MKFDEVKSCGNMISSNFSGEYMAAYMAWMLNGIDLKWVLNAND